MPITVYIVSAGQYDSWCEEASFTTRELAEQYIANATKRRGRYDHVNPQVIEGTVYDHPIDELYHDLGDITGYEANYTFPDRG